MITGKKGNKINMRSTSNFLPALNTNATPTNSNNNNNMLQSPQSVKSGNIKLENRVFYMEKAVARLIHSFESIGTRLNKIDGENNNNAINIGALSKTIKEISDGNKDFISKQHLITERLVTDIHKQQHSLKQQTSFINKEISDIRDSIQILSTNLQKNFNESIKAAISQCNDLNIQNSNSITSLRKITDQKISHLQQLIVDTQKRAQSQNTSILDIINSNQKNQTEFQNSFKTFFEKFRDSMHGNLNALQESTQEQISYLDNVLRAEVKTRMKNTQNINKDIDEKIFQIEEIINQNKRDNKRSWEYINKNLESIKEQQKHQQTANQPLHKIITNLTKQFDEMSQQHLTDIKSIMQLNQDTSEKQFNQIKSLQIQIQQIYSKLSAQEKGQQNQNGITITSPQFSNIGNHNQENQYKVLRPQSYKSDMSSTAAFNAIKHHLAHMPGKPNHDRGTEDFNDYVPEVTQNDNEQFTSLIQKDIKDNKESNIDNEQLNGAVIGIQNQLNQMIDDKETENSVMESNSEFQDLSANVSPRPDRPEREPFADNSEKVENVESGNFEVHVGYNPEESNDNDTGNKDGFGQEEETYGDENYDEFTTEDPENKTDGDLNNKNEEDGNKHNENMNEKEDNADDDYGDDIDNMLGDDGNNDGGDVRESRFDEFDHAAAAQSIQQQNENENNENEKNENDVEEDNEYDDDNMEDVDNVLGDNDEENKQKPELENETNDNYSEEYGDDDNNKETNNATLLGAALGLDNNSNNNNDNDNDNSINDKIDKESSKDEHNDKEDDDKDNDDISSAEKALEALEQEQSELNENYEQDEEDDNHLKVGDADNPADDNYSDF